MIFVEWFCKIGRAHVTENRYFISTSLLYFFRTHLDTEVAYKNTKLVEIKGALKEDDIFLGVLFTKVTVCSN